MQIPILTASDLNFLSFPVTCLKKKKLCGILSSLHQSAYMIIFFIDIKYTQFKKNLFS